MSLGFAGGTPLEFKWFHYILERSPLGFQLVSLQVASDTPGSSMEITRFRKHTSSDTQIQGQTPKIYAQTTKIHILECI